MELIPEGVTVAFGGSATLKEIGLLDALREMCIRDRYTAAFIGVLTDWSGGGGRFDPVKRLEKIFLRLYRM